MERKHEIRYSLSDDRKRVELVFGIRFEFIGGNTRVEITKDKKFSDLKFHNAEISYPSAGLPRPSIEEVLIFSEMLKEAVKLAESLDTMEDFESYLMEEAQKEVDIYWNKKLTTI